MWWLYKHKSISSGIWESFRTNVPHGLTAINHSRLFWWQSFGGIGRELVRWRDVISKGLSTPTTITITIAIITSFLKIVLTQVDGRVHTTMTMETVVNDIVWLTLRAIWWLIQALTANCKCLRYWFPTETSLMPGNWCYSRNPFRYLQSWF